MSPQLILTALLWPALVTAQVRTDSGYYVATLGRDTVAIERFVRSSTVLQSHAMIRLPETRVVTLTVRWDERGRLLGYEQLNAPPRHSGGAAAVHTVATVIGDSVRIVVRHGNAPERVRVTAAAADVPMLNLTYSLVETAVARAAASRASQLHFLSLAGGLSFDARWGADSVLLRHPQAGTLKVLLDRGARMRRYDGTESTFKVVAVPAAPVDVDSIAGAFAQRDRLAGALGTLSPRDTARAMVDGASIWIDYGRPAARGRVVFGSLVPLNRVWRTGANAATQIELSHDIEIHGVSVPAGKYSVWTVPARNQWQLIINRQTGQWGTDYDASQDLVRIPIAVRQLRDAVERFTIAIHDRARGGEIRLSWENTQAIVPFTVK